MFGILGLTLIAVAIELAPILRSRSDQPIESDKLSGSVIADFEPKGTISATGRAEPFQGMLRNVKDYTPLNEEIFNEQGYGEILAYLKTAKPEDLKQKLKGFNYNNYFTDTQKLRGEVGTIIGLIIKVDPVRLPKPVSENIEFIYRTYLVDTSGTEGYVIDVIRKPGNFKLRKDVVKIKGVFYKIVTYEGKKGREKEAPLCLGIQIDPFAPEKSVGSSVQDAIMTMMLLIGGIFFFGFIAYLVVKYKASRPRKINDGHSKLNKPT